jgi:hypothetical protein
LFESAALAAAASTTLCATSKPSTLAYFYGAYVVVGKDSYVVTWLPNTKMMHDILTTSTGQTA